MTQEFIEGDYGGLFCSECKQKVCMNCYTTDNVDDLYCMICSTSCCYGHDRVTKNRRLHTDNKCVEDLRARIDADMDRQRERSTMPEYTMY